MSNDTTTTDNANIIKTAHGGSTSTTNDQGATITWEMVVEAMSGVLKPHHVEGYPITSSRQRRATQLCVAKHSGDQGNRPEDPGEDRGGLQCPLGNEANEPAYRD